MTKFYVRMKHATFIKVLCQSKTSMMLEDMMISKFYDHVVLSEI